MCSFVLTLLIEAKHHRHAHANTTPIHKYNSRPIRHTPRSSPIATCPSRVTALFQSNGSCRTPENENPTLSARNLIEFSRSKRTESGHSRTQNTLGLLCANIRSISSAKHTRSWIWRHSFPATVLFFDGGCLFAPKPAILFCATASPRNFE